METITKQVSPILQDELVENVTGGQQCSSVHIRDKVYYTYLSRNDLEYNEWMELGNVYHTIREDGLYNYIIFKSTDGRDKMLFAKHIIPNELGSKHMSLFLYAVRNGLTNAMKILMAGEIKKEGSKCILNFQSGTYTKPYKELWPEDEDIEQKWFEVVRPVVSDFVDADRIDYRHKSFLNEPIPFYPEAYLKLQRLNIESRFFDDPKLCKLYKIKMILRDGGVVSSLSARGLSGYLVKDNGVIVGVKPEYKDKNGMTLEEISSVVRRRGGGGVRKLKKTRKRRRVQRRPKHT